MTDLERRASITLLAFALAGLPAACGGGADGGGGAPPAGDSAAVQNVAAAAGDSTCPPGSLPLPATGRITPGTSQPWSAIQPYLDSLTFDAATGQTDTVTLCPPQCSAVKATIQSVVGAQCLPRDSTSSGGNLWLLGRFQVDSPKPPPANLAPAIGPGNDSARVYLLVQGGQAYALYERNGQTAYVPPSAQNVWKFQFCSETHPGPGGPRAQWQPVGPCPGSDALQATSPSGQDAGWMACLTGCCRFYGSPPGEEPRPDEVPGKAKGRPDSIGKQP